MAKIKLQIIKAGRNYMENFYITVVKVNHRVQNVHLIQEIFTKYADMIEVRLGLHESDDVSNNNGLIILQLAGDENKFKHFEKELNEIESISAKLVKI